MNLTSQQKKFISSPWIIGLFLFLVFLLTNGYQYGWDDQHLEIPMLKSLIDPTYYQGDYYVETLKKNFPSYFYRILSKIIHIDQIPSTYFLLYLISRYFLFFWIYKLWHTISNNRFAAISAVLTFILIVRVDEFLYRTFSHQEFVFPFIFAGFYFFYKDRFLLASFLFGIGANIHGIYSLFPMLFMLTYLLWKIREHKISTFIKSGLIFTISALPFIIFVVHNRLSAQQTISDNHVNWLSLFITACPQNFLFPQAPLIPVEKIFSDWKIFYTLCQSYIFIILLFCINLLTNNSFRTDKKILSICFTAFILLLFWGFFTYIQPNRFVLDLNLGRNIQFLTFFLTGYLVLFLAKQIESQPILIGFLLGIIFTFLKFTFIVASYGLIIILLIYLIASEINKSKSLFRSIYVSLNVVFILLAVWQVWGYFSHAEIRLLLWVNLAIIFSLLTLIYLFIQFIQKSPPSLEQKRLFLLIPLVIFTIQYSIYHYQKLHSQKYDGGFWQLQRDWEQMQHYVRDHTDKEAMIFTPYNMEMGGFRIFSERKVVVCYRDIGLIGFDYSAAVEWAHRIHDVEAFQVNITKPIMNAIQNAIVKYNADYIVFMRYSKPTHDTNLLTHLYSNESFSLYRVNKFNSLTP